MSSPFVAEIRMFGCNFAPTGWAQCNGQLLPISQNTALFSLLGTFYGGDGKSTFALPNFQGSTALNQGDGPGLSPRFLGESAGSDQVTLLQSEIASHTHTLSGNNTPADRPTPAQTSFARTSGATPYKAPSGATPTTFNFQACSVTGSSFPHNNLMPYLVVNFCIALQGVFPPRT
jgi:microcystin-dependent protein